MKTLILLRHAKSSRKQTDLSDFERPLNSRGRKDAPEMGRRLAQRGLQPSRIISSPAKRARATAELIAQALGFPQKHIAWETTIYDASLDTLLSILRNQPDSANSLVLIGHNPGLTLLANALTQDKLENLPTSGAYIMSLPINHWKETQFGIGKRLAFDAPKLEAEQN